MDTPTYPYMSELKDLIKEPKTLRSMKHTNWSDTQFKRLDCEFNGYYIKVKASNNKEFYEIQKELNNAVINRLELSEELLSKFEFSEHSDIINFDTNGWCKFTDIVFTEIICLMGCNGRYKYEVKELYKNYEVNKNDIEVINKTIEDNENKLKDLKIEFGYMEKRAFGINGLVPTGLDAYLNNECKIINRENGNFTLKKLIGKQQFIKIITHATTPTYLDNDRDYEHSIKYATEEILSCSLVKTFETYKEYYNNNENYDIPIDRILITTNIFKKKGVLVINYTKKIDNTLFIPPMFNITKKRMKALDKEKVKEDKYIECKGQYYFKPYEENGIECLFVKPVDPYNWSLGYRVLIDSIKYAYSENMCNSIWCCKTNKYVKSKDIKKPTKKDDIIKVLMKL